MKTSKTQPSQYMNELLQVNSSLENWRYNSRYDKPKTLHLNTKNCDSCGSELAQLQHQTLNQSTEQSHSIYLKGPFTPVLNRVMVIPDVSQSVSRHKEDSKLSLQLNQISLGFNQENKRIQQALFEIRQTSVQKEKRNSINHKSMTLSRKAQTSKKQNRLKVDPSIVKVLNYSILQKKKNKRQNSKKENVNFLNHEAFCKTTTTKLKKKNLNQLMKQQKIMLKSLASSFRNSEAF